MIFEAPAQEKAIQLEHDQNLYNQYSKNLKLLLQQLQTISESGNFVPTQLIHEIIETKQNINTILKRNNLPEQFSLEKFDINPEQKMLREFDDREDLMHLQKLLEMHHISLQHALSEKGRLQKIGYIPPIVDSTIEIEKTAINQLEKQLYQTT